MNGICLFCGQSIRSLPGGPTDCCDYRIELERGDEATLRAHKLILMRRVRHARTILHKWEESRV